MELKIKSITEAFSMQPITLETTDREVKNHGSKFQSCKEIKLETIQEFQDETPTNYYVGYNFQGKRIFQYLSKSVNVHYEIQEENDEPKTQ